ncbi:hypothetical protein [Ahrensia kielensis]|uniref:hypothetical protein n=1 Tax=Ahrensia kielensis TaxID=76980 RepID=UPI00036BD03C|nr:hypothetical protein [Ahrensia kielensis]
MIPTYTPELITELARRQMLHLPEERLELIAATLTHVRTFIATLDATTQTSILNKEADLDETL